MGTIIQSIFGAQSGVDIRLNFWKWSGESRYPGALSSVMKTFVPPFLPTRLTAPRSPRMIRYFLSIKCVTRKFHVVVVQSNGKEIQKGVLHVQSCFFLLLIRLLIFLQFSLPSPFSIARFYLLFEYIISILTRASLLALAKSILFMSFFTSYLLANLYVESPEGGGAGANPISQLNFGLDPGFQPNVGSNPNYQI